MKVSVRAMMMVCGLIAVVPISASCAMSETLERHLCAHGIKIGMNKRSDGSMVIASVGRSSFEYSRDMSNDDYFFRRDRAVSMAYAEALSRIACFMGTEVQSEEKDIHDANDRQEAERNEGTHFGRGLVKDGFEYASLDEVPCKRHFCQCSAVDGGSEVSDVHERVVSIRETASATLSGFTVVKSFTSVSDGAFSAELLVVCDPQFGQRAHRAIGDGSRIDGYAKELDIDGFVEIVADGLQSAPCTFVDKCGIVWGVGVSVGARGQRPFGSKLDGMARDSAAFALGCEVTVKKALHTKGSLTMHEQNVDMDATKFPYATSYPECMSLYFHKDVVDPVTGRKCTVSVCALPAGAEAAALAEVARKRLELQKKKRDFARIAEIRALFSK